MFAARQSVTEKGSFPRRSRKSDVQIVDIENLFRQKRVKAVFTNTRFFWFCENRVFLRREFVRRSNMVLRVVMIKHVLRKLVSVKQEIQTTPLSMKTKLELSI